jgi:hypothetical protein
MMLILCELVSRQEKYEFGIALGHTNIASSLVQGINTFFYQAIS